MVELTLPEELQSHRRQDLAEAGGRAQRQRASTASIAGIRTTAQNPRIDTYYVDHDDCGADGPRRADLDQEQDRSDADLPPLLPRGRVRLLRDEHRRHQHARLHQAAWTRSRTRSGSIRCRIMPVVKDLVPDLTIFYAQHASIEPWLQTVDADAREGMAAEPRGPREARRALRVHPVRLLLDLLPELLVELRPLSRPGRAAAGQPLARSTPATRRPASGSTISKTRSGSTAATPS